MVPAELRRNKWIARGDPTQVSDVLAAGKRGEERARACPLFASCLRIFYFSSYFRNTSEREELRNHEAEGIFFLLCWFVVVVVVAAAGDLLRRQTMRVVGNNWRRVSR